MSKYCILHSPIMEEQKQIAIYEAIDGQIRLEVNLDIETVWLTQQQMQVLFGKNKRTISEHISNVFKEGELDKEATVRNFRTVQFEGNRDVNRNLAHYNLDVVISVGYRVKSKTGTQFRIWANKILKEYITKGYVLNKKLLNEAASQLQELKQAISLIGNVVSEHPLSNEEAKGLLHVITDYAYALDILDQYDHQKLAINNTHDSELFRINYSEALHAIDKLRQQFGGSKLFGREKDESFQGSLAAIYQTFNGEDLYPSIEEKAAHLLYFITKNHSFSDGNKRIAAFIFIWFMDQNKMLYTKEGSKRIADNALVALTLLIAESKAENKDMIVRVIINLINAKN